MGPSASDAIPVIEEFIKQQFDVGVIHILIAVELVPLIR